MFRGASCTERLFGRPNGRPDCAREHPHLPAQFSFYLTGRGSSDAKPGPGAGRRSRRRARIEGSVVQETSAPQKQPDMSCITVRPFILIERKFKQKKEVEWSYTGATPPVSQANPDLFRRLTRAAPFVTRANSLFHTMRCFWGAFRSSTCGLFMKECEGDIHRQGSEILHHTFLRCSSVLEMRSPLKTASKTTYDSML